MSAYPPSGPYGDPYRPGLDEPYYSPVPGRPPDPMVYGQQPPPAPLPPMLAPVPPAYLPAPPPPNPMPAAGTEYVQFLRTERHRWWKGLVAIVLLVVGYLGVSLALALPALALDVATGRISEESLQQGQLVITPAVLLAVNLSAALLIPLSMLLQWGLYGQPVRWLHSVRGHLRWDLLRRTALLVGPLFLIYVALSIFVFPQPPGGWFTWESAGLLAVVLLTTPLQAAGEEYGARGLIARASGSWFADPRLALIISTVVSATIFMLAHGATDPWLIVYYFGFGIAMSIVVWRTGGLEVAVLIHTLNNVLFFMVAILAGQDLAVGLDRSAGTGGSFMLVPMVVLALTTGLVCWWANRNKVSRGYEPAAMNSPAGPPTALTMAPPAQSWSR
jgi:uncharacterized protein